mmetsp:Transcript_28676/g.93683  ORF Transcript_28676/g.93683 Transcript_28676/m.93683 type:complete len:630 (-) Transcript_28676:62-1951(-)
MEPPAASAPEEEDVGPALPPPPKRKRKGLAGPLESVYADALPCANLYERSWMHRDTVTVIRVTSTEYVLSGSADGHVKFWKKAATGSGTIIEFVKHFRAHVGPVVALVSSADGLYAATTGVDQSVKVFDVLNFDLTLMIKLTYQARTVCFISKHGEAERRLAVSDAASPAIHVYDVSAASNTPLYSLESVHAAPVIHLKYAASLHCVVSADEKGHIEVWDASPPHKLPEPPTVQFKFKLDTDLYAHVKNKEATVTALELSADSEQFVTVGADRRIRVFRLRTGKLRCILDESLENAAEVQRTAGTQGQLGLEAIDFGRRMAVDRELESTARSGGAVGMLGMLGNAIFDQSGEFLLYPTHLGVKVVNLATGRLVRLLGKLENTERFLHLALFQGVPTRDKRMRGQQQTKEQIENANTPDPTILCTAVKKGRLYAFTRREPDESGERDVFNERPAADDLLAPDALGGAAGSAMPNMVILHTSLGDVHFKLYVDECPKTCENFTVHCRDGYYDGLIFHRVIKSFMLQTGDPLGDGTGGQSIWGGEFEDEIRRELRHDRPYTLSMANAGPNTNGSQFFITTVATPWLDGKHTVFGRVIKGADVCHSIERVKVDQNDKPLSDVKIVNVALSHAA